MKSHAGIQGAVADSKPDLRAQLAEYLAHQPESTQNSHRWMKRLEMAGIGIIVAAFIAAMYVSINWKSVSPMVIPIAWFFFAASVTPTIVLVGIHTLILGAFPPIVLLGKKQKFVTGRAAAGNGWGLILGGVIGAAFWGLIAYAVGTFNVTMLEPLINILGVALSVVIAVAVLFSIYRNISRSL
jgi:hypothetical protein